ncbi:MAG TPA: hypothetical protein PLP64_03700 [Pseudothermotoga sp.]|nr:hypothetical protein [Pseudothermotoga sp.]HOK83311.1 hypothetical protein [Pseudothermotoga sp.]HPP70136.1 hypothetical protein [Pseudothermotoga sp.]
MYLAITLVLSGICLIFFGAKVFFGILFISLGAYVLVEIFSHYAKSAKRAKQLRQTLRDRLHDKLSPEDLQWIEDMITPPFGKKFLIIVNDNDDSTNVRIALPFSLVIVLKPFLKSLLPFFFKFFKDKTHFDERMFQIAQEIFISCVDELMNFSGDFVTVESKGTTVRIGIV